MCAGSMLKNRKQRRASVAQGQTDQRLAQALNKDYLAIVGGDKVLLFEANPSEENGVTLDDADGVTLATMDISMVYYTRAGTKIRVEGDDSDSAEIFFNDSITAEYKAAKSALELRSTALEEEEDEAEEEVTVSLKEELPYSGMELQARPCAQPWACRDQAACVHASHSNASTERTCD